MKKSSICYMDGVCGFQVPAEKRGERRCSLKRNCGYKLAGIKRLRMQRAGNVGRTRLSSDEYRELTA